MRFINALLLAVLLPSLCDAQLFRRRERVYPCYPEFVPSAPHPGLNPEVMPDPQPDATLTELEAIIPPELRIRNRGGNCGWCALEDVMVAAGYEQFKGITARAIQKGWGGNTISNVEAAIRDSGIDALVVKDRSMEIFRHARQEGVGVYVQIPGHALVCLGLDSHHAYMLDNNPDSSGKLSIQKWARNKFDRLWEGVACCPKRRKKPKEPAGPPAPTKPATPAVCPCPVKPTEPAIDNKTDLKPVMAKIDDLGQSMIKLTETACKITDSLGATNSRLSGVEGRLMAVEKTRCACPGAGTPVVTPPPPSNAELDKIREDLNKLRQSMKFSGTLTFTVDRK